VRVIPAPFACLCALRVTLRHPNLSGLYFKASPGHQPLKHVTANTADSIQKNIIHIKYTAAGIQLHTFKTQAQQEYRQYSLPGPSPVKYQHRQEHSHRDKPQHIATDIPVLVIAAHITMTDPPDGGKQLQVFFLEVSVMMPADPRPLKRPHSFLEKDKFCKNAEAGDQHQPAKGPEQVVLLMHNSDLP